MTVAIYQKLPDGMFRLGTFTVRRHTHSIRAIGEAFLAKHPHFDPATLYIASRSKQLGVWVEGERLPYSPEAK